MVQTNYNAARVPLVSVVIVTRNVERYLSEAIESILKQTFDDFELVILDFGSTDRSKDIVAGFAAADRRVRFYETCESSLVDARNAGCSFARGKYIAVMDADDVSLPQRLEQEVALLQKQPEIGLVGGTAEWIDGEGRPMWVLEFPLEDHGIRKALPERFPFCHSAVMVRRDLFARVGGYRRVFTTTHDYDLCLRVAEKSKCANVAGAVVRYRVHGAQISLGRRRQQTLCKLAAQGSAAARRAGLADPLDGVEEITSDVLTRMGISMATQQQCLATDYCNWIHSISKAGESAVALQATEEALQCDWSLVDPARLAAFYLNATKLYWRDRQFFSAARYAVRTLRTQPTLVGQFVNPILWRLHISRASKAVQN